MEYNELSRPAGYVGPCRVYKTQNWNFASKYIRIRAFHKAISRSCILLRFNNSRTNMITNNFVNTYTKRLIITLLSFSFYANFSNNRHSSWRLHKEICKALGIVKRNAGKRSMLFTFAKTKKKTYLAFRATVLTRISYYVALQMFCALLSYYDQCYIIF